MKKNKGFLLISSVFLTLFLGITLSISLMRSEIQLRSADLRRASQAALYAAEAGIEQAIFRLRREPNWRAGFNDVALNWEDSQGDTQLFGYYNLGVANGRPFGNLPTVWLLSVGRDSDRRVSRYIRANLIVENPAAYFTSTIGNLTLVSGADIAGSILGRDVIFEVNPALPSGQRRINVNGDVSYIRNIIGHNSDFVTIEGNINQRPPIAFVSLDLDRYRELAQQDGGYINGDFTYSGEINREILRSNNGLIFAEGNIYISGRVTESMHFVSARNIYIEDDIVCPEIDGVEAQIGLSAAEDIIISARAPRNIEIDAYINADGGMFRAEGTAGTKDELNFSGAIAVKGREKERTGVNLNVYSTRNYVYDSQLRDNLQIPFMSFMVNIRSWEEVGPDAVIPPD